MRSSNYSKNQNAKKQQPAIPGGKIVFKDSFQKAQTMKQVDRLKQWEFLYQQEWWLNFSTENWQQLLPILKEVFIKQLHAQYCGNQIILDQICEISFPKLKILNISFNSICSVQILQRVKFPRLRNINLQGNFIVNTSSLRKSSLATIEFLSLTDNKIQEFQKMQEIWSLISPSFLVQSPISQFLNQSRDGLDGIRLRGPRRYDCQWIFKLDNLKFNRIGVSLDQRHISKAIKKMVIKKLSSIQYS